MKNLITNEQVIKLLCKGFLNNLIDINDVKSIWALKIYYR